MTAIDITEFEGYELEEFREFVKTETTGEYELSIPKATILFSSDSESVSWEFAVAAYIGQKLNEISASFTCSGGDLSSHDDFVFEFKTTQANDLAELLLEISSNFGNEEIREPFDFSSEVGAFMEEFKDKDVVCQDFFDTAIEYQSNSEDDEDENGGKENDDE